MRMIEDVRTWKDVSQETTTSLEKPTIELTEEDLAQVVGGQGPGGRGGRDRGRGGRDGGRGGRDRGRGGRDRGRGGRDRGRGRGRY